MFPRPPFLFFSDVITKRSRSNTGSVSEGKSPFKIFVQNSSTESMIRNISCRNDINSEKNQSRGSWVVGSHPNSEFFPS